MAHLERLQKLRQRLLDHPERFDYSEWLIDENELPCVKVTEGLHAIQNNHCGTVGCIAGHAFMQCVEENTPIRSTWIEDCAQEYLDLTYEERKFLFLGKETYLYGDYREEIYLPLATIIDAIERLDVIIDHWSKPLECEPAGL